MYEAELRGMFFRQPHEREYASAISIGSTFDLEREPDNAYDAFAIKVTKTLSTGETLHLGYIAKEVAAWVAPELDEGRSFRCTCTGFYTKGKNTGPILSLEEIPAEEVAAE